MYYATLYDGPLFDLGIEDDDDHELWAITFADPSVST